MQQFTTAGSTTVRYETQHARIHRNENTR